CLRASCHCTTSDGGWTPASIILTGGLRAERERSLRNLTHQGPRPRHREGPQPDIPAHWLRPAEGVGEDRSIEGADEPIVQDRLEGCKVQPPLPEEEAGELAASRGLQGDVEVGLARRGAWGGLGLEDELDCVRQGRLVVA